MTQQDRALVNDLINKVRNDGQVSINLDHVSVEVFRNLYHIAKNLESDLNVEIIEPGKTIRIFGGNL